MQDREQFDMRLDAPLAGMARSAPFTEDEEAAGFLGMMAAQMPGKAG